MHTRTCFSHLIILATVLAFFLSPQIAMAANWIDYNSEDGLLNVTLPDNYRIKRRTMRVDGGEVVTSTEITADVDQRPYKELVNQYIIKYDQTLSHSLDEKEISQLIDNEIRRYEQFYQSQGGVVLSNNKGVYRGYPGVEMVISYASPEDKQIQTIRIRIMFTSTTRLEQIVIGKEDEVFSVRNNEYFDTMSFKDGRVYQPGDFNQDWDIVESDLDLFKMRIPFPTPPYFFQRPDRKVGDKAEKISVVFKDPIYRYNLYYNVYAYRLSKPLMAKDVQGVLMDNHLRKLNVNFREMSLAESKIGEFPVISTKMTFPPIKKYPYLYQIWINAYYYGNYLVVQELVGNPTHINSGLARSLMQLLVFTPFEGDAKLQKERSEKRLQEQKAQLQQSGN